MEFQNQFQCTEKSTDTSTEKFGWNLQNLINWDCLDSTLNWKKGKLIIRFEIEYENTLIILLWFKFNFKNALGWGGCLSRNRPLIRIKTECHLLEHFSVTVYWSFRWLSSLYSFPTINRANHNCVNIGSCSA